MDDYWIIVLRSMIGFWECLPGMQSIQRINDSINLPELNDLESEAKQIVKCEKTEQMIETQLWNRS